jgi:hypothetical protein
MLSKSIAAAFLLFLLAACAVKYQPAGEGEVGYRDLRVDQTTFYVEYTEHDRVSWEEMHRFALQRCAEIATDQGFAFFDVLEKEQREVALNSHVDQIQVVSGNAKWQPPSTATYSMAGAKVRGKRVTYKIRLSQE